jgi:hypothetical protein
MCPHPHLDLGATTVEPIEHAAVVIPAPRRAVILVVANPAPLVRIDPGLLVRNDPPLSEGVGDRGCRRAKEAPLLKVSALVSA